MLEGMAGVLVAFAWLAWAARANERRARREWRHWWKDIQVHKLFAALAEPVRDRRQNAAAIPPVGQERRK
jgi:hypothetical protein